MTDPRENCPWKCKHCLCYEGEINRLTAENKYLRDEATNAFNLIHDDPSEARRTLFRALRLDLVSAQQNDDTGKVEKKRMPYDPT